MDVAKSLNLVVRNCLRPEVAGFDDFTPQGVIRIQVDGPKGRFALQLRRRRLSNAILAAQGHARKYCQSSQKRREFHASAPALDCTVGFGIIKLFLKQCWLPFGVTIPRAFSDKELWL